MKDISRLAHFVVWREQGKTYQEIGEMYNVSKQYVASSIKKFERLSGTRVRKNNYNIEKIAYKGIYQLFENDSTMTIAKLSRMICGYSSGVANRINCLIKGEDTRLSIKEIKKLIEITGKPFEELFELREKEVEQK